jgi:hypothetical protein
MHFDIFDALSFSLFLSLLPVLHVLHVNVYMITVVLALENFDIILMILTRELGEK